MTGDPGTGAVAADRPSYPVRVDAVLEPRLSRWLWLVKWLLLIPHFVVLAFLWIAYVCVSMIAFFAILITARYPRALFDFNVGVLRWSWRVHYYGYGALGTDRYPPFTLAEVRDYPAHLDVPYPERLSRGLVLVKWWLLAIPHYIVVAVFVGGGLWLGTRPASGRGWDTGWASGGLVGLLVLIAAIVLLFSGRYPEPLYDFVMGMDRWVLRVAAYVGLMTDRYPPFRLDSGGPDPATVPAGPPPTVPIAPGAPPPAGPAGGPPGGRGGWTAGRIISVVIGALLLFAATGLFAGGGWLLWADRTHRDAGYLWTPTKTVSTSGYAITAEGLDLQGSEADRVLDQVVGGVRIRATSTDPATALFIGVTTTAEAQRYLSGVHYTRLDSVGTGVAGRTINAGGSAPATAPSAANIWQVQTSGTGTQTLQWKPTGGNWAVVVQRADGGPGLTARLRAGATVPAAPWIATGLLVAGVLFLAIGGVLVGVAASRASAAPPPPPGGQPAELPRPRGPSAPEPAPPIGSTTTRPPA
jgi:hypothetical protein